MTLTEFLLARIAEDEERANETHLTDCVLDHLDGNTTSCVCEIPARVVAECEAKRRIVEEHGRSGIISPINGWDGYCRVCNDTGTSGQMLGNASDLPFPCPTLRILAAVYADHPDYDEEWKP